MISPVAIASICAALALCVCASILDIKTERVPNKLLIIGLLVAVPLDAVLYIFVSPDLFASFAVNAALVCVISLILFYTHTWAGGDCKLACVLAILYPAEAYVRLDLGGNILLSLPLAIAFAFGAGVVYLLVCFCIDIAKGRVKLAIGDTKKRLLEFGQSYLCALSLIGALYVLNTWLISPHFQLNIVVIALIAFCCIWLLASAGLLKSKVLLAVLVAFDVAAFVFLGIVPLGANPIRYLFVLAVLCVRVVVAEGNYRLVPTDEVEPGMILSMSTCLRFVGSRVKGLPAFSTEDLRSRLSDQEAESVRRWGNTANGQDMVQVVRKVPFAVFVSLGFAIYFVMWGVM